MAKTLAALETEVRSHLDALAPAARARWRTLRIMGGVVRALGTVTSGALALVALANTAPPILGVLVALVAFSAGLVCTRVVGGWITLVAVKDAVRALEGAHSLGSVGGTTSVALPPPTRSMKDRDRTFAAPRPKKVRLEAGDREARDFDDAG